MLVSFKAMPIRARLSTCNYILYDMTSPLSGQDEPNLAL